METTRIKWDEGMLIRCLAKCTDAYPERAAVKKQTPIKAAESDFTFKLDIPSASPSTNAKTVQKSTKWDDFKIAIDHAL
ncbi:MAG: hypothetical protein FIA99_07520 [Ruminiclostridium sp.]|nr:hypothetical protein [Ruminiclostridium sp.]